MVDRAYLSVKSGLAAKKLAVSPFCLENIHVARFGLVSLLSPYASMRDWDFWNGTIGSHEPIAESLLPLSHSFLLQKCRGESRKKYENK